MARVGAAAARSDPAEAVRGRVVFDCAWRGLRAYEFLAEAQKLPEGYQLNNVVTLNLGGESVWETNFERRGWHTHERRHHYVDALPANVPYEAREHAATDRLVVEVTPDFVAAAVGQSLPSAQLRTLLAANEPFVTYVLLALGEEARQGGSSPLSAESLGTALVAHLATPSGTPPPEPLLPSPRLRRVLAYVGDNLDAPLTLQRLADLADMDLFRFVRAFKRATGASPHRYVLDMRIARAKELLRDPTLPITDIAMQTGFASPSHFSVTFRRIANVTPREFREGRR
jgi:AraC family transcriptional regulator